ncbi:LOW QUALITY PROTEIN: trinucleotide repeat-containing gene 6C protein [Denticeps clupeoides]|uniref:LOW QUALITY PROTEIN: trinucleotide repeat-containing gene 6C protein n=1 Tax=Denticeps clupeoides TaxID=299321 RepID=UPI0010A483EF|nr:LOW QUALITY PROTEIN: trinucleotide repeat-containing gene 6C protein-like [Denticeps clupeoides]
MEEKKKKKQEEKKKKQAVQKKATEQKTKVPESATPSSVPLAPAIPSSGLSRPPVSTSTSGNGKRVPTSSTQPPPSPPPPPPPPQQQQQQTSGPRYPPREVPPRFRQQEHKQLLKRGQPLPPSPASVQQPTFSSRTQAELPQHTGPGTQYENRHWGHIPTSHSATNVTASNSCSTGGSGSSSSSWEKLIIDNNDTEEWPTISHSLSHAPPGCHSDADCTRDSSSSQAIMATGAGQTGHFPTSSRAGSSQGAISRGWGSSPSVSGGEGQNDSVPIGKRGQHCWGSSNFNLNLNPNANPSAWPLLGHEGSGSGVGSSGGTPSSLCSPPGAAPNQGNTGNMGGANGNSSGNRDGNAWGSLMSSDPLEPRPSQSTNVSFSSEPQNLNTDGPNHPKQQPDTLSPVHSRPLSTPITQQVNGEEVSIWGSGDTKASASKDTGWGHRGIPTSTSDTTGWGQQTSGNWAKHSNEAKVSNQEQLSSWTRSTAGPACEGSSNCMETHPHQRDEDVPVIPAQDLDPRVLCNTGWGQTPVHQHTAWETEEAARRGRKNNVGTEAWGSSSTGPQNIPGGSSTNPGHSRPDPVGKGGDSSTLDWGTAAPPSNQPAPGWGEKPSNGGWANPPAVGPVTNNQKNGQNRVSDDVSPSWDNPHSKAKPQGWSDGPKSSHSWANGSGSDNGTGGQWGDPGDGKRNGPANAGREGEGPTNWTKPVSGGGGGGWVEPPRPSGSAQGWNNKPQEGDSSSSGASSIGSWGGPGSVKQPASGWGASSGGPKTERTGDPTGWEEPSPPSIRRKLEIDDGTSAWGDPTACKAVNLWDRNKPKKAGDSGGVVHSGGSTGKNTSNTSGSHHQSQPPPPGHRRGSGNNDSSPVSTGPPPHHSRAPATTPGWGEMSNVHAKPEPSWGEAGVDAGTSAWGKPSTGCSGWRESSPEVYGLTNPPPGPTACKPASKPMQEDWRGGGEDMVHSAGQWEPDDGDMWNSTASQESNSSCSSWGNPPKKGPLKATSKHDDAWMMSRLIKQLTDMGFPREPAEEALKSNNMNLDQAMSALLEKKMELDRRCVGVSDYSNGLVNKQMGCRTPLITKELPSDHTPFGDKDAGLVDDPQTSPFMPSTSLKLPLANPALPGHALGVATQNLNSRQVQSGMFVGGGGVPGRPLQQPPPQPSVPPLSSSQPSLRTQVPQFLSPQVQAQLLQFAAKNIGLNPALLTSPINPQHMTLLNQLYQLQLTYQRLQLQQQMLQAQRNVSGPIRQQEQQVARTISNMQQQIQQHQRQLTQALLMKQQQPPSHPSLHPNSGKSALDSFPGPVPAPGRSELQTKETQSSPNAFSSYPLSALHPSMNVNCLEVGGVSLKDTPQPQSRLSQWTHPNSMDNHTGSSSPLEPGLNKHSPSLGKPPLDESYPTYGTLAGSEPSSPLGQGKSSNDKLSNGTNVSWPPEFCPGVPWKGLQNIDPETDPNVTPGSVPSGPTINTNIHDVNRYLLRDRNAGKLSDMKSTWSPGPISHTQTSLSQELWKVPQGPRNTATPTRPPPGLTSTKSSSTWSGSTLGLVPSWGSSYSSGTTWSTDSSSRTSSWLVLRNLTPQIDGSTLRTLCLQHGPLITFHLNLTQGNAVVRYSSREEAAKAQKSLHMCVLGNTTILAEFAGEEEVNRFFAQSQTLPPTTTWQANHSATNQTRLVTSGSAHTMGHWNTAALGGGAGGGACKAGGELLWGGAPQYSTLWGPPSTEDGHLMGSPSPINTLLPGDLLSGESM